MTRPALIEPLLGESNAHSRSERRRTSRSDESGCLDGVPWVSEGASPLPLKSRTQRPWSQPIDGWEPFQQTTSPTSPERRPHVFDLFSPAKRSERFFSPPRRAHGSPPRVRLGSRTRSRGSPERHEQVTLERRQCTRRQRRGVTYSALSSAAGELLSFPHVPDCGSCGDPLDADTARWGTGLCDSCYDFSRKECSICKKVVMLKQLQWNSGLCRSCFNACEKKCKLCKTDLAQGQLHWNTGLCDHCYDMLEISCRMCRKELDRNQRRWGSGLCDGCYDSANKTCLKCKSRIAVKELRWETGLCDFCFDSSIKDCESCGTRIPLGSIRWQSGLCDPCYDQCDKSHFTSCDLTCEMCKGSIEAAARHRGTGLCEGCYTKCKKECKLCAGKIKLGELHWGSGICDECYGKCDKKCRKCSTDLALGTLHYGTGLCDTCYDRINKECRRCSQRIDFGQLHWGTGFCDACYDSFRTKPSKGLSSGVQATIGAQVVFYMAPALLQPSLYIHIKQATGASRSRASSIFAAVLTGASIFSMVAPVPLGLWAERRGEREVYCSIVGACAVAAISFVYTQPGPLFGLAWAVLNGPPAIRGVRAAYFAKHVVPQQLTRAGQLASSAGLIGGFFGPLLSIVASHLFGEETSGSRARAGQHWWSLAGGSFAASAGFATLLYAAYAAVLWWHMPPATRGTRSGKDGGSAARMANRQEICDVCSKALEQEECTYATALCNNCYDNYWGDGHNFRRFCMKVLGSFTAVACALEASMNAAIIATFQPILVNHFQWGSRAIAAVNFAGTGLSVAVSLTLAHLHLQERNQVTFAALLYLCSTLIYTTPPLAEWRLVLGLLLGLKAQIIFMAPFTTIFSRLIGPSRVTIKRTTMLCLAPAIGAAVGTASAPLCASVAGTPLFTLSALPAAVGCFCIVAGLIPGWEAEGSKEKRETVSRKGSGDLQETC